MSEDKKELNENELDKVTGGALHIAKAPPCESGDSCPGKDGCDQYDSCTKDIKMGQCFIHFDL